MLFTTFVSWYTLLMMCIMYEHILNANKSYRIQLCYTNCPRLTTFLPP